MIEKDRLTTALLPDKYGHRVALIVLLSLCCMSCTTANKIFTPASSATKSPADYATSLDGGIMVTASHNPINYNGMKLVREECRPISEDTGLIEIKALAERANFSKIEPSGTVTKVDLMPSYISHLLSYVKTDQLSPIKIVVNAGNGGAGAIIDLLEEYLPFEFIIVY